MQKKLMQKLSLIKTAVILPLILVMAWNSGNTGKSVAMAETVANTLTVTGQGDRSIPTTKARVMIAIAVEAKTAQEAQSEVARRTNAVITELKNLKVDKLQTTNVSLNPKIEFENNKQRQVGFIGETSMSFVTSIERSGLTIDRAIATGANRVSQITFSAEDETIQAARNSALQDAVKDAQKQANAILSSLNLKPLSIRTIQVNGDRPQGIITNRLMNAAAAPPTSIIAGDQTVQASVTLEIMY
jgi:uncharacterized protein YggE